MDALDIWELAAVLGRNEAEEREPWPEDAPHVKVLRRLYHQGNPPRTPIDDEEYAALLALAKSGTRKEVSR